MTADNASSVAPRHSTTGYVSVPGALLYYQVAGEGHPLVLVHGGLVDCRMWGDQVAEFARHFRVVRYDLRGHGRSTRGNLPYSSVEDLHELLVSLGIGSAYLVAQSMSGGLALAYAILHPDRVAALVLVDSAGVPGMPPPEDDPSFTPFLEAIGSGDASGTVNLFLRLGGGADPPGRGGGPASQRMVDAILLGHS